MVFSLPFEKVQKNNKFQAKECSEDREENRKENNSQN